MGYLITLLVDTFKDLCILLPMFLFLPRDQQKLNASWSNITCLAMKFLNTGLAFEHFRPKVDKAAGNDML